jgi:hypothetical protein
MAKPVPVWNALFKIPKAGMALTGLRDGVHFSVGLRRHAVYAPAVLRAVLHVWERCPAPWAEAFWILLGSWPL